MKFTIIKSCLARFSGIFVLGTPSNIHGTVISYRCAKFGAFVNSVTILTLRDLTSGISVQIVHSEDSVSLKKPSAIKNNFLCQLGLKNLFYVILNDFCTLALIRLRRDRAR